MLTPIAVFTRSAAALRRLLRDRRANAALEMALTAPALLMFVFGIVEFGRAMWLKNALDFSVAEAARCASVNPTLCGTAGDIQSYAAKQAGAGFTDSVFTVSTAACGNQVSANYPLALTIPFVSLSVTLSSDACYPT
jgi:Flp pilus assembly protein TadG